MFYMPSPFLPIEIQQLIFTAEFEHATLRSQASCANCRSWWASVLLVLNHALRVNSTVGTRCKKLLNTIPFCTKTKRRKVQYFYVAISHRNTSSWASCTMFMCHKASTKNRFYNKTLTKCQECPVLKSRVADGSSERAKTECRTNFRHEFTCIKSGPISSPRFISNLMFCKHR